MDTRHLRYFLQVADDLSFTRAARTLFVAQQTLSDAITQLEKQVGVTLLDRSRQRVAGLTPAGEVFAAETRAALDDLDRAIARTRAADRASRQQLVVGGPDWPWGLRVFREAIAASRERNPELVVTVEQTPWVEHLRAVADGLLDVGTTMVADGVELPPDIAFAGLADEDSAWVVVRDGHPLLEVESPTIADVGRFPVQYMPRRLHPGLHDVLLDHLRAHGVDPSPPSFLGAMSAAVVQAGASEVVVWVTARQAGVAPPGLVAVSVPEMALPVRWGVIWRRDRGGPAVELLVDELKVAAGRLAD